MYETIQHQLGESLKNYLCGDWWMKLSGQWVFVVCPIFHFGVVSDFTTASIVFHQLSLFLSFRLTIWIWMRWGVQKPSDSCEMYLCEFIALYILHRSQRVNAIPNYVQQSLVATVSFIQPNCTQIIIRERKKLLCTITVFKRLHVCYSPPLAPGKKKTTFPFRINGILWVFYVMHASALGRV